MVSSLLVQRDEYDTTLPPSSSRAPQLISLNLRAQVLFVEKIYVDISLSFEEQLKLV